MVPKLDWKSDEVRDAIRTLVLVCLACIVMYSAAIVISFLPVVIEIDRAAYLATLAKMTADIFTTAAGVFFGLSGFFVFLRSLLEVEERARRETVREEG
jgi:hypothetical protein